MTMQAVDAKADDEDPNPPLLRLKRVLGRTGLGRSTLYKLISEDAFPSPVQLAKRAVAWRREDVDRWASERVQVPRRQAARRAQP